MDCSSCALSLWCIFVFSFLSLVERSWAFSVPYFRNDIRSHTRNDLSLAWREEVLLKNSAVDNEDPFEVVSIGGDWREERDNWDLEFEAFKRPFKISMTMNSRLASPSLRVIERSSYSDQEVNTKQDRNCHWIGRDGINIVAGISDCNRRQITGLILLDDSILEIQPLTGSIQQALMATEEDDRENLHIVKRSKRFPNIHNDFRKGPFNRPNLTRMEDRYYEDNDLERTNKERLTLEVALFFDQAGYEVFAPFYRYDSEKIRDLLLAYLNGVQALYYHPSLGEPLDIVLVYMEIMKQQPKDLPTHGGERSDVLDSFCEYQKARNPRDGEEGHWDMGLYVSGLDFFAWENDKKNGATMGLATVGGVCLADYNCITAEFGVTNQFGRPFPSAGFTSIFILAHEIGHNLGMSHDSKGNECLKDGFIMSPTRGTQGETLWSSCSREVIKDLRSYAHCLLDKPKELKPELDAMSRFKGRPGATYTAKRQCEILLIDQDAVPSPYNGLDKICQNLPCKSPHRIGYYFAGPALEGTICGDGKWCSGGDCVESFKDLEPPPPSPGGWSDWIEEDCRSGCILKSKGSRKKHRSCNNPLPINSASDCEGLTFDISLCEDREICNKNRYLSANNFASLKCREFSQLIPELDGGSSSTSSLGIQAIYEEQRLWVPCAIFCLRKDIPVYYSPRLDLNDLGRTHDAYFPDGTYCHNDGRQNYYCLHHHCLPETFKFTKADPGLFLNDDIPFWLGNASPGEEEGNIHLNNMLFEYLSLDPKGHIPLRTKLSGGKGDEWDVYPKEWNFDDED